MGQGEVEPLLSEGVLELEAALELFRVQDAQLDEQLRRRRGNILHFPNHTEIAPKKHQPLNGGHPTPPLRPF